MEKQQLNLVYFDFESLYHAKMVAITMIPMNS